MTYVKINADFTDEGFMEPRSLAFHGKEYPITQLLDARYLPQEDAEKLFPGEGKTVYQFKIRIARQEKCLYYEPEAGRWFVDG